MGLHGINDSLFFLDFAHLLLVNATCFTSDLQLLSNLAPGSFFVLLKLFCSSPLMSSACQMDNYQADQILNKTTFFSFLPNYVVIFRDLFFRAKKPLCHVCHKVASLCCAFDCASWAFSASRSNVASVPGSKQDVTQQQLGPRMQPRLRACRWTASLYRRR